MILLTTASMWQGKVDHPGVDPTILDVARRLSAINVSPPCGSSSVWIVRRNAQLSKLYDSQEVCRLRDTPILTFVNKLDRVGRDFLRTHDLFADALLLFERGVHDRVTEPVH
jgi:hypothetical protein